MGKGNNKLSDYNTEELFKLEPLELTELLLAEYNFEIPYNEENISIHDLYAAQKLMAQIGNYIPYMAYLNSIAKIKVRKAKRDKLSKDEIDDAIDRKEVINNFYESLNMQYNTVSRLVTVKKMINEELRMTDGITI